MEIAADGSAWVASGGGIDGRYPSSVSKLHLIGGRIEQRFLVYLGKAVKGLSLDSQGNAWVASQGDDRIYGVRPDGTVIGGFLGGGIDGPWGATVDGEDNIWVRRLPSAVRPSLLRTSAKKDAGCPGRCGSIAG